jgi:hypothetical protein
LRPGDAWNEKSRARSQQRRCQEETAFELKHE